eukprot:CFRG8364T1
MTTFPDSWGTPPGSSTEKPEQDMVKLIGGYGYGDETLEKWVSEHFKSDMEKGVRPYPPAWGEPPRRQTRDLAPLPCGYGVGSGTLAGWIKEKSGESM